MTEAPGQAVAAAPARPQQLLRWLGSLVQSTAFVILLVDLVLMLVFGLWSTEQRFWSSASLQNMAVDASQGLLLAVGLAMLLGAGEFDISLGGNLLLASVIGGKVAIAVGGDSSSVLVLTLIVCLASGAAVGLVNAFVVRVMKVNSLIATLATLGIATGIANLITGGSDLLEVPASIQTDFGLREVAGIPLPALVAAVVAFVAWLVLKRTRYGLRLISLGSSRDAAERAGLRIGLILTFTFVMVGVLAGLAGFMDLARFSTTNLSGHQDDALAALTAAVIGGTSLFGGRVSIGGVVAGVLLAEILQSGLVTVGLSAFYQQIAIGVVLVIAVAIDQRRRGTTAGLFSGR